MFLHPGRLTRRYIDGERVKFVSPMALFLFTVFLMFAVFAFTGGTLMHTDGKDFDSKEVARAWQACSAETATLDGASRRPSVAARALGLRVRLLQSLDVDLGHLQHRLHHCR